MAVLFSEVPPSLAGDRRGTLSGSRKPPIRESLLIRLQVANHTARLAGNRL